MPDLDFPLWLRVSHLINFFLIGLLIRSGWQIIATHPRFYWRNDWWYYGPRRPFFYGPAYGLGYYEDYPDYHREVAILMRDRRSQQIVYETRAMHTSRWTSNALLPAMFEAALKDFPLPALSPRTVTVALPKGA